MGKQIITYSPKETQSLAKKLAKDLFKNKLKNKALVLALEGDLGGGKTTFLQGFAQGLGIKEKILSPTFVIMRKFKIRVDSCSDSCRFVYFYHIDCYRIQKPKEIFDLGWDEIINNPENIVAVEWADRIRKILPKKKVKIKFKFVNKNIRLLTIDF